MGRQVFKNDLGSAGGYFYRGGAGDFSPDTVNGYFGCFGCNGVAGIQGKRPTGEEQACKDNTHNSIFFIEQKWATDAENMKNA